MLRCLLWVIAAAIRPKAHSNKRNIHASRPLSHEQEADAVQRRQRKPFETIMLRPSGSATEQGARDRACQGARRLQGRSRGADPH